jgi:hypothetical protein
MERELSVGLNNKKLVMVLHITGALFISMVRSIGLSFGSGLGEKKIGRYSKLDCKNWMMAEEHLETQFRIGACHAAS